MSVHGSSAGREVLEAVANIMPLEIRFTENAVKNMAKTAVKNPMSLFSSYSYSSILRKK